MEFILEKVEKSKKDILYRLLQYSLYEESMFDQNEINEYGIYEYKWFDNYFLDEDRDAYFIKMKDNNKLLGFVMVNTYTQIYKNGHSIAEFMILPKFRKNKIGKYAAITIFDKYRGNWEIKPSSGNEIAYKFWEKVIKEYTNNNYKFENSLFIFNNE